MDPSDCGALAAMEKVGMARVGRSLPGATTGDPTHNKGHAEETWQAKADQASRDPLNVLECLPQNQNLSTVYYIMPFTNSSDISRGLSPTTFIWKKSN